MTLQKVFVQDITQDVPVRQCGTIVFNADNLSNTVSVELYEGADPLTLSGSAVGAVIRADGLTVPLTGSISGNTASVTLTAECFAVPGQISVGIQIFEDSVKTTVLKAIYNVDVIDTGSIPAGGDTAAGVAELVEEIQAAVATIPEDYTQLQRTVSQQNEQMLDNFGRILSKTRIMTVYEIGRYLSNGFTYSNKYARNSKPFPAGVYMVGAYAIGNRACQYVSDSEGTWLTSTWATNAYVVIATGPWYVNFASEANLTASDIAAIESNFVIERVNTEALEYCVSASGPLLKNVLVPDFAAVTYNGVSVSKECNIVRFARTATPESAFLVELSGAARAFFTAAPSNSDYTPTLANLLPVELANPLKISVRNLANDFSQTRYICIQWASVSGDTVTKLTPITRINLDDAKDTIRISTFDIPTGATHFVILLYATRSTAFSATDYSEITIDFESPQIAALLTPAVTLSMVGGE